MFFPLILIHGEKKVNDLGVCGEITHFTVGLN